MAARGPKMPDGVWKGVFPQVFGPSKQLSLNKFFDPSIPSMRKVDDGEKKRKKKRMLFLVDRLNADRCLVLLLMRKLFMLNIGKTYRQIRRIK